MISAQALETEIVLTQYTTNVEIFTSTKAKDIPGKIDAIAVDLKNNINLNTAAVLSYINDTVIAHINTELAAITDDHNTITSNLITQEDSFESSITTQQNNFELTITSQQNTFETNMSSNITDYISAQGVGYNVNQSNNLEPFTTTITAEDYTFDDKGRITTVVEGYKTTSNIEYDEQDRIISYTETLNVDGIINTKSFTVSTGDNGTILITEVV